MAEELGDKCMYHDGYSRCDNKAYNPAKAIEKPLLTPDGRRHWILKGIKYYCEEHAMDAIIKGSTSAMKVSYEELEDIAKDKPVQINVKNRDNEKQKEKLKNKLGEEG